MLIAKLLMGSAVLVAGAQAADPDCATLNPNNDMANSYWVQVAFETYNMYPAYEAYATENQGYTYTGTDPAGPAIDLLTCQMQAGITFTGYAGAPSRP